MFFKNVLATLVGLFIFSAAIFLILIIAIGLISSSTDKGVTIADNTVLHLRIDRPILERSLDHPLTELSMLSGHNAGVGLKELKQAIARASEDDRIEGIFLEPKFLYAGLAKLKELRNALEAFKETGKFVIAYGEYYTEAEYFLASVADEVYLPAEGMVEFNGFRAEYNFLKGTMDKLGIETQVFRVGDYKSAVEPFTRTDMSPETRRQTASLLSSIYEIYLVDIARTRNLETSLLRAVADSMLATNAKKALEYKLITDTKYYDQVLEKLKDEVGIEASDKLATVRLNPYLNSTSDRKSGRERIAVVFADGDIVNGKGNLESIGSESLSKQIRKLREDDGIKAIVLRVNSPGGSSLASDVIWREVALASEVKPIIASMSDVAASGGYYIAMACDTIVAQPMTITGSIGIYSMYFNAKELLEEKLGITTDVVKTGLLSDVFTVSRPLTDYEKALFQGEVNEGYKTFISKAAEARGLNLSDLDSIAGGRVWSGIQARNIGLVDVLGSLDDAVSIAAAAANLEEDQYRVRYYPPQKNFWEMLISDFGGEYEESRMRSKLGDFYPFIKQIKNLHRYEGVQTRMPFDLTVQ